MKLVKQGMLAALLCLSLSLNAQAADCISCAPSQGSAGLSAGSGLVLVGSMSVVAASGMIVVESVVVGADGIVIVVKGISNGVSATIKLSGQAAQGISLAAGTVINTSAMATGYLLVASGTVLAFIPNEIGQALIHHSKVGS
ncbi:hypothetical protein [Solimicrobium silvestre]|uniref:Uncharacterized protein n=1 Tax=Solimicrobium silvestre TaxID=2099400 RepID=A0A2S9GZY1_9BURK|nr:hypothetical protein [Solimicrobium silvestre]PRC93295.1 hypothetical protein S2091_2033 [Solimicrobium silvestre]